MSAAGGPGEEHAAARVRAAAGAHAGSEALDPRAAEVLQQLRSGVRQRQAEAATVGGLPGLAGPGGASGLAPGLLAVKSSEYVQEPVPFSHRPRLGRLIVASRKAFFHLWLKWFLRPLLAQQNAFNQAAGRLLQQLAEAHERSARETRLLAARVTELEARATAAAAVPPASAAASSPVPGDDAPEHPSSPKPSSGTPR